MAVIRSRYNPLAARIISVVIGAIIAVLLLHILFVLLSANVDNPLVVFISGLAGWFGWLFTDLFTVGNAQLSVLLNYGLAIVVYAAIGAGLRTLFRSA